MDRRSGRGEIVRRIGLYQRRNDKIVGTANAEVAQLVEQWTENPCVGGSNPPLGTIRS